MHEQENTVLQDLLEGRFKEAIAAIDRITDTQAAALLRSFVRMLASQKNVPLPQNAESSPTSFQDTSSDSEQANSLDQDPSTGLLNRRGFLWRVRECIEASPDAFGILFVIGMDNLRYVNEKHGYEAGDKYIECIINALKVAENRGALVARPAGDEFAVYAHGFASEESAIDYAQSHRKRLLNTILELPGETVRLRTSLGAALYPIDSDKSDILLHYADYAMFNVQNFNRGTFMRFNPETYHAKAIFRNRQERLDELLECMNIRFAFQPVIDLRDGSVYGYEALMRSLQPEFTSPLDILQLAEGQYKLPQLEYITFKRIFEWVGEHIPILGPRRIFFNIITANFLCEEELSKLSPEYSNIIEHMVIEIAETTPGEAEICRRIQQFRKHFTTLFAIDDYGCAYSNIFRLLNLAPDIVKLDRFFVSDIHKASEDRKAFIRNFVKYCKQKHITTVAEGVETKEELGCIIKMGFDLCQGFYLGRPEFALNELTQEQLEEIRSFVQSS